MCNQPLNQTGPVFCWNAYKLCCWCWYNSLHCSDATNMMQTQSVTQLLELGMPPGSMSHLPTYVVTVYLSLCDGCPWVIIVCHLFCKVKENNVQHTNTHGAKYKTRGLRKMYTIKRTVTTYWLFLVYKQIQHFVRSASFLSVQPHAQPYRCGVHTHRGKAMYAQISLKGLEFKRWVFGYRFKWCYGRRVLERVG